MCAWIGRQPACLHAWYSPSLTLKCHCSVVSPICLQCSSCNDLYRLLGYVKFSPWLALTKGKFSAFDLASGKRVVFSTLNYILAKSDLARHKCFKYNTGNLDASQSLYILRRSYNFQISHAFAILKLVELWIYWPIVKSLIPTIQLAN
jgi:hypothetical protein